MPFETGLCSCLDDKQSCLDGCCCPCCQSGRQCAAVEGQVNQMNTGMCCLYLVSTFVGGAWIFTACLRCKIDEKYNLGEGKLMSCCTAMCCERCALCQAYRQLAMKQAWPGGICVKDNFMNAMQ